MTFKLHNDPVPPQKKGRGLGATKYPWADMEVGNGFYVPLKDRKLTPRGLMNTSRVWAIRRGLDWKFTTRIQGDQVGIWRIR